jgi:hypothetical protein
MQPPTRTTGPLRLQWYDLLIQSFFNPAPAKQESAPQQGFFTKRPNSPEKAVDQKKEANTSSTVSSLFFNRVSDADVKPVTESASHYFIKSTDPSIV